MGLWVLPDTSNDNTACCYDHAFLDHAWLSTCCPDSPATRYYASVTGFAKGLKLRPGNVMDCALLYCGASDIPDDIPCYHLMLTPLYCVLLQAIDQCV